MVNNLYYVTILATSYFKDRVPVPTLSCEKPALCDDTSNLYVHRYYRGTYNQINVLQLGATIYSRRCSYTIDDITCRDHLIKKAHYSYFTVENLLATSKNCRNLCDSHYNNEPIIFGTPDCSVWKDKTTRLTVTRIYQDYIPYDARIIIKSNMMAFADEPWLNPFASGIAANYLSFVKKEIVSISSSFAIVSDETKKIRFIQTSLNQCQLVLSQSDIWFFTGNDIYVRTDSRHKIEGFYSKILLLPETMDEPGYQIFPEAIELYLSTSDQAISAMCGRLQEQKLCEKVPNGKLTREKIETSAKTGVIYAKKDSKIHASQCRVVRSQEIDTKNGSMVLFKGKTYQMVNLTMPVTEVIDFYDDYRVAYPHQIDISFGETLVHFDKNYSDSTISMFDQSFALTREQIPEQEVKGVVPQGSDKNGPKKIGMALEWLAQAFGKLKYILLFGALPVIFLMIVCCYQQACIQICTACCSTTYRKVKPSFASMSSTDQNRRNKESPKTVDAADRQLIPANDRYGTVKCTVTNRDSIVTNTDEMEYMGRRSTKV